METRQAVVLAGGLGTRLRASAGDLPKPLVPVRDKPFLRHLIELLRDRGMKQVLLLTGYQADAIHDYFARHPIEGIDLAYSREPAPLGTAGAIRHAASLLAPRFALVNGDTYLDVPYAELLERGAPPEALATMVIYRDDAGELDQVGNVDVDDQGFLRMYRKAAGNEPLPYIDAGVSLWSRDVFETLFARTGPFSLEQDVFPELVARRQLWSWTSPQRYYDIGTPERLATFERSLVR